MLRSVCSSYSSRDKCDLKQDSSEISLGLEILLADRPVSARVLMFFHF